MEPLRPPHRCGPRDDCAGEDLSEEKLASLLAEFDCVKVAMADGNWTKDIPLPPASPANQGRVFIITHDAGYNSVLTLNRKEVAVSRGFKKSYTSDGKKWNENASSEGGLERKPQHFGVPVVTLIGYYDPVGEKQSYIYPALHGAYGFCYADDGKTVKETDCELQVETRSGVLRFRLANERLNSRYMNKFHVNVPEASLPRSVAVVRGGKVLDKKPIMPVAEKLSVTGNGIPVSPNAGPAGAPPANRRP